MEYDGRITIVNMKANIQGKEGIPPDQQRLRFAGRTLQDGDTLAFYDLRKEIIIRLEMCHPGAVQIFVMVTGGSTPAPVQDASSVCSSNTTKQGIV